jgi:serine-type D-Ala-D-Ala endopeptidase (penicillin-binding protein 7)
VGIGTVFLLLAPPPATAFQTTGSTGARKPAASKATKAPAKKVIRKATTARTRATRARLARTRAAAAARARLAAAARQQQEAMTPRFKRDLVGNLVPDVRAAAAIIFDPATGEVLWEENSHDQRSIASITKVMTALVFLADEPDLTQRITVAPADVRNASITYLRAGETITYDDVLHLMLIASDNGAARVLARTSEGGTQAFVARMNEMAQHLNLKRTRYTDPSGLESTNLSSAYDLSQLIAFAAGDPIIADIMRTQKYEAHPSAGPVSIHSTNKLLGTDVDVRAGKTGFIGKAGYCLATLLQLPQGNPVAVVVLGAANSATRFGEARHLFNWVVGRTQGLTPAGDSQN